ncbi:MAG: OmpA family protein [Endomicrobiaceae bacterium]|nr:OmpA family protein [Endomicrobiaceae bacterium]
MKKILLILLVLVLLDVSFVYSEKQSTVDPISIETNGDMLSPNGDGIYENIAFRISVLQDKLKIKNWKLNIINTQTNEVFDRFSGQKEIPKEIIWEGKNKKDKIVDGTYKYELLVSTKKKNIKIEKGPIFVDVTPPYLSLTSSNDVVLVDKEKNKFSEELSFRFTIGDENKIDKTKTNLKIVNFGNNSTLIKEWKFDDAEVIPQVVRWDGRDDVYNLVIPAGEYRAVLTATDEFGNRASMSLSFTAIEQVSGKLSEIVVKEEPRGLVVNLSSNILFETGKSSLKKEATASLDETISLLNAYPANKVLIEGYTDSTGSKKANLQLSYDRAQEVYIYFVKHGIPAERLNVVGYGQENPVASNKTAQGRAQNRRVNVIILKSDKANDQK